MDIKLKNLKHARNLSEETNAFTADVYVDGKKVAYAKNDGHGGNTMVREYPEPGCRETLDKAEAYAKTLPPIIHDDFELPMDLEFFIDELVDGDLKEKEQARFKKKMEKEMLTGIVVGVPDTGKYGFYNLRKPLSTIPKGQLHAHILSIRTKLKKGEKVLNTNLEALGINI